MARIIEITDFADPALDVYVRLTGAMLRNKLEPQKGIFIAESPTVIDVALNSGLKPLSLLTDRRLINKDVRGIIDRLEEYSAEDGGEIPIYVADRDILTKMTGFELTRGALCAMRRPTPNDAEQICRTARRVAVLESVTDSTNVGALFRSAAALNIDAVLLSPTCCDPLTRRALRVSMGTVLQIPYAVIDDWPSGGLAKLSQWGFKTVAMALTDRSVSIDDPKLNSEPRLAIVLGTEGDGLAETTIATCDYTARIPMSHGVDSLNVAAAGAVAFWQLAREGK